MGLPNYLFKKYNITYYEKSWQHTLFYIFSLGLLFVVYKQFFFNYFSEISFQFIIAILFVFMIWLIIPKFYKNDYYSKKERLRYQLPKFFEILFQQFCFLAGLLTFGVSTIVFGILGSATINDIIYLCQE